MTDYRFLFLDATGSVARTIILPCQDDLDALARAAHLHDSPHLQVWEGSRIVIRMDDHGEAENGTIVAPDLT